MFGRVQIFRWLNLNGTSTTATRFTYDPVKSVSGKGQQRRAGITLQPNQHINQSIDYNSVRFDRAFTGERVFSVDIVNLKTTYQFRQAFPGAPARAIRQFASSFC